MKNKRRIRFMLALTASICLSAATFSYVGADYMDIYGFFEESSENSCYIIDFMDCDGNLLDSKICAYGEKLTDIITPEPKEDEKYIYQFAGWEPQISETVTECAAYMATYQKIRKDGAKEPACSCTPELVIPDQPTPPNRASSNANAKGLAPEEITQVSSTSYDVTRFTLETPTPKAKEPAGAPMFTNPSPQPDAAEKENVKSEFTQTVPLNRQTEANTPLLAAASPAPGRQNVEISPQFQETLNANIPETVSQDLENSFAQIPANTVAALQEKPADATTTTESKRLAKNEPSQKQKMISKNAQMTEARPAISASAASKSVLPENKQSYRAGITIPILFIGMVILGGIRRITQRKHVKRI